MTRWPLSPAERLFSRVVKENDCIIFQGAKSGNGYGAFWFKGRQTYAHRVAYELVHGEIPNGSLVLHKCDNPPCINIDHLFLGSHKVNTQDMFSKGRWIKPSYRGRELKDAIIDLEQQNVSRTDISTQLGISKTTVLHILNGNRWSDTMSLYSLRTDGDEFRITKFTNDLDVESSYLTSHTECQCPAGSRPTCRHRQMLPTMLAANLCDSGGFYDFESQQVLLPVVVELELPEGVTVLNIDSPEQMHNALADALGEPRSYNRPSYAEGEVGVTPEELAAKVPTYEEMIETGPVTETEHATDDKPHPHLPKVDRRI